MLIIRLQRVGRKNDPKFRLVLTESKNSTKSGKFLEILGSHDFRRKAETVIKGDRIKELIKDGAQVTDTVRNLLITHKILTGKKVNVLPKKTPIKKEGEAVAEAPAAEAAPAAETPATESTPAA